MRRDLVLLYAWQRFNKHRDDGKVGLVQAALEGDMVAWEIFFSDAVPELEIEESCMTELMPGQKYIFLTSTNYYLGEVERANIFEVVLKDPNFICYVVGELSEVFHSGKIEEYDYAPARNHILLSSLVNYWDWTHPLPSLSRGPRSG